MARSPAPHWIAFKPSTVSPADILFIVVGCALMLVSIFHLYTRSRVLGSYFLVPLAVLGPTGISFIFALRIAIALNMPIHPTALAHALPFLIAIIGFDTPLTIAHAVFHTRLPCALFHCSCHFPHPGSPITIILVDSLAPVYPSIIRGFFFEITLLALAAYLPIGGLCQLSALAALTLAVHFLVVSFYFIPTLSLMLRSCILKIPNDAISMLNNSTSPSHLSKLSSLLGEKGTSLYNPSYTIDSTTINITTNPPDLETQIRKNPSRLKLLIFAFFFVFNFITPLTPSHHLINQSTCFSTTNRTIPDISSPITAMLSALTHPDTLKPGNELYIKLYPQPSTSPSSLSFFSSHISRSPDHFILSLSLFSNHTSISISLNHSNHSISLSFFSDYISLSKSFDPSNPSISLSSLIQDGPPIDHTTTNSFLAMLVLNFILIIALPISYTVNNIKQGNRRYNWHHDNTNKKKWPTSILLFLAFKILLSILLCIYLP